MQTLHCCYTPIVDYIFSGFEILELMIPDDCVSQQVYRAVHTSRASEMAPFFCSFGAVCASCSADEIDPPLRLFSPLCAPCRMTPSRRYVSCPCLVLCTMHPLLATLLMTVLCSARDLAFLSYSARYWMDPVWAGSKLLSLTLHSLLHKIYPPLPSLLGPTVNFRISSLIGHSPRRQNIYPPHSLLFRSACDVC